MKKFFLIAMIAFSSVCGFSASGADSVARDVCVLTRGDGVLEAFALYIPNRLIDALDMFSLNLGAGPFIEARLMCTRLIDVGAGAGLVTKAFKDHNRQYGFGIEENYYWSLIFVGAEDFMISNGTSLIDKYLEQREGVPQLNRTYDFFNGPRDYWAIGGSLGCLIDGNLYIHPLEWVDFALGFFFIDIKSDDLTFESFR